MNVSEIQVEQLNRDIIDQILFEGIVESEEKEDSILVLGSSKACRRQWNFMSKEGQVQF